MISLTNEGGLCFWSHAFESVACNGGAPFWANWKSWSNQRIYWRADVHSSSFKATLVGPQCQWRGRKMTPFGWFPVVSSPFGGSHERLWRRTGGGDSWGCRRCVSGSSIRQFFSNCLMNTFFICPLKCTREVNDFIWSDGIHLSEVKGQNHVASPWQQVLYPQLHIHLLPSDVFIYLSGPDRRTDRTGSKTIPSFSCLFLSAHRKKIIIRSILKVMKSGDSSCRNVTASPS